MLFSLWIIKEWFSEYDVEYNISTFERSIKEIRFKSDNIKIANNVLYVEKATDHIVLRNNSDYVMIITSDFTAVINILLEKFTFYNDWSDGLRRRLHLIDSEEDLINQSTAIFPDSILMLSDTSYFTHAFSYYNENSNIVNLITRVTARRDLDMNSILDVEKNTSINKKSRHAFPASLTDGSMRGSLRYLYIDDELIGSLAISNMSENVLHSTLHLQDELGNIIEEWFSLKADRKELWKQSGLFIDILEGVTIPSESLRLRLFLLGWEIEHEKVLYLVKLEDSHDKSGIVIRKINQESQSLHCFQYEDYIVVVANTSKLSAAFLEKELLAVLCNFKYRCVKSRVFQKMPQLRIHFKLLSGVIGDLKHNAIYDFADLSMNYVFNQLDRNEAAWIIDNGINKIRDYDSRNCTDFLKTLEVFLFENCNYTTAANILSIHRSTLIYRINRIMELGDFDIEDSVRRKKLMFSFMILEAKDS